MFTPQSGAADAKRLYTEKTYKQSSLTGKTKKSATTALVETYTNKFGKSGVAKNKYTYSYDSWGNITGIVETGITPGTRTYGYNEYGEVTNAQETYSNASTNTYLYQYDQGGNIISETIKSTTGNNTKNTTHTYGYRESGWKDQLISYDGKEIKYDELGNPINYMGDSMTWNPDGTLASITGGGNSTTTLAKGETVMYTYLADGMRYTKTANGKTTTYHYNNGILLSESTVDNNASNPEATKETIRYRGYHYDQETGFYYLKARYYDAGVRRFISEDDASYLGADGTIDGYNLYAYCDENPVALIDVDGYDPGWALEWMSLTWWLPVVDGPLPVGDIIFYGGIAIISIYVVTDEKINVQLSKHKSRNKNKGKLFKI